MEAHKAIKNRKTQKVLADKPLPLSTNTEILHQTINDLLGLAAAAPYHKKAHKKYTDDRNEQHSCLPWRFYTVDALNCRKLLDYINKKEIKAGKISNMLAAADVLFLVTWLPEPTENKVSDAESRGEEPLPFEGNMKNMEHLAAASAAIQNVLVGATARNLANYWSSGGLLRNAKLRNYLNISMEEILLGAIFIFPENVEQQDVNIKTGSLRNEGKEKDTWSRWVQVSE